MNNEQIEELPAWRLCELAVERNEASALEQFIYNNEPAGPDDALFRSGLAAVVAEARRAAPVTPAPQAAAWQPIATLKESDDLVWLRRGDSTDGPRPMDTYDYDRFSEWAPCEPPLIVPAAAPVKESATSGEGLYAGPMPTDLSQAKRMVTQLRGRVVELSAQIAAASQAQAKPVAWGAFHFGGADDGKLYNHADTEAQIKSYIADVHQCSDSITLRAAPLYTAAPSAASSDARDAATNTRTDQLNAALMRAAAELPEGYNIVVEAERGAGWVEWRDPENEVHVIDTEDCGLAENVETAISEAFGHAALSAPAAGEAS